MIATARKAQSAHPIRGRKGMTKQEPKPIAAYIDAAAEGARCHYKRDAYLPGGQRNRRASPAKLRMTCKKMARPGRFELPTPRFVV